MVSRRISITVVTVAVLIGSCTDPRIARGFAVLDRVMVQDSFRRTTDYAEGYTAIRQYVGPSQTASADLIQAPPGYRAHAFPRDVASLGWRSIGTAWAGRSPDGRGVCSVGLETPIDPQRVYAELTQEEERELLRGELMLIQVTGGCYE
jgi:uncharacterized protein (DUF736 family)